jgi:hypothetical protein
MAKNYVLIVSEEFLNRINVGLNEIAAKFAVPVMHDIANQIKMAETGAKDWVDAIESHLTGVKLSAAATAATAANTQQVAPSETTA